MYYFIVNPTSKSGLGEKYWKRVQNILEEKKIPYQVQFSACMGHVEKIAEEWTKEVYEGRRHLIILGGDGTVNEAVQGIHDFSKVTLSYIPTGSSNDLARDMGISRNPEEALDGILNRKRERKMDIGLVHYDKAFQDGRETEVPERRFMVGCGIGYDAAVCEESLRSRLKKILNRVKLGKLTYVGIALKQLIKLELVDGKLILDESREIPIRRMFFAVAMVHRYEGGGFQFCPKADDQDGYLDFCVASDAGKLKALRILPTAYAGRHIRFREIQEFRAKKASFEMKTPLWVQTDGEVKTQAFKITVSDLGEKVHFVY